MPNPSWTADDLRETVEAFRQTGGNVTASARCLNIPRTTMQSRLHRAGELGLLPEYNPTPETPLATEYMEARARKQRAYEQRMKRGDWREPVTVRLPYRPFRLVVLGDPHIDNDACDFEAFERAWMSMGEDAYGVCVGDFFDNWKHSLSHLWKENATAPSDAWILFHHLMEERGKRLVACCSGNHDDWSHAPIDPIWDLMRRTGVPYRQGAIRIRLDFDGREMFIAIRHKWKGSSMYSAAHGIVRAARFGWADDLMIGGHIHQDEARHYVSPDGRISHCYQVSSFKSADTFADVHGFMAHKINPAWHLVIDPRLDNTDPDMIKAFWDAERADNYLASL